MEMLFKVSIVVFGILVVVAVVMVLLVLMEILKSFREDRLIGKRLDSYERSPFDIKHKSGRKTNHKYPHIDELNPDNRKSFDSWGEK